jgi:hypothetical protein
MLRTGEGPVSIEVRLIIGRVHLIGLALDRRAQTPGLLLRTGAEFLRASLKLISRSIMSYTF